MTVPQSRIQVDSIERMGSVDPVQVSYGASVPSGATFTINGNSSVTGVLTATNFSGTNITSSGIVTATFLAGDGSALTNLPTLNESKSIAFTLIG